MLRSAYVNGWIKVVKSKNWSPIIKRIASPSGLEIDRYFCHSVTVFKCQSNALMFFMCWGRAATATKVTANYLQIMCHVYEVKWISMVNANEWRWERRSSFLWWKMKVLNERRIGGDVVCLNIYLYFVENKP
jgi:hypothetical protein